MNSNIIHLAEQRYRLTVFFQDTLLNLYLKKNTSTILAYSGATCTCQYFRHGFGIPAL